MTQSDQPDPTFECLFATITGFLLPFFLAAVGGNMQSARTAVVELIGAYAACTPTELDLVGRIVGFSVAAMDNLRLSMGEGLSDTKILRYRSNAVALSRAAEQARLILKAIQEKQENTRPIPRPTVAAAPKPEQPRLAVPTATTTVQPAITEAMKSDARLLMAAFSKQGAQASTAIASIPGPSTLGQSAVTASRRT